MILTILKLIFIDIKNISQNPDAQRFYVIRIYILYDVIALIVVTAIK